MGIWEWVQEKASSIYTGISKAAAVAQDVLTITSDILSGETFRKTFSTWFMQSWQGVLRIIDLPTTIGLTGPQSRRVWARGEATALVRLLPVVGYQFIVRPYAGSAVRAVTNNGLIEFAAVGALDLAANYVLLRRMLSGVADNMFCSMAMAKATTIDSATTVPTENPLAQACPHGSIAHATAGLNSSVYYYGNRLALYALARTLPYGEYFTLPLLALFYGAEMYLERPLSAAGNCAEHRLEVRIKNKPFCFGVGATYLAAHRALQYALERYCGVGGIFVDEALSSMLALHFIMVANLTRNIPLPGTEPGPDPFYLGRAMTDLVVTQTMSYIEEHYKGAEESDWYKELKVKIGDKWETNSVRALRYALLCEDMQDIKKLVMRPTAKMYLELCGGDVEDVLQAWIDMRKDWSYQTVDYFKGVLPKVMEGRRKILSLALDKYLEEPIPALLNFMREVRDPEFGTMNQKNGLYAAARRERPPVVEILPEEVLPQVAALANLDVQGLYSVARRRFANAQSLPMLAGNTPHPSPPSHSPSAPANK